MRFRWLANLFAAPQALSKRPLRDLTRFDIGVCPRCRGLRAVASPRCNHCSSEAPVTADA